MLSFCRFWHSELRVDEWLRLRVFVVCEVDYFLAEKIYFFDSTSRSKAEKIKSSLPLVGFILTQSL